MESNTKGRNNQSTKQARQAGRKAGEKEVRKEERKQERDGERDGGMRSKAYLSCHGYIFFSFGCHDNNC